jgi:hypothetical protein
MGADNMRKLMETAGALTERVRRIPMSKVTWDEENGLPGLPIVKGLKAEWYIADWQDFNDDSFAQVADALEPYKLNLYVIQDTGADYVWFAIAP